MGKLKAQMEMIKYKKNHFTRDDVLKNSKPITVGGPEYLQEDGLTYPVPRQSCNQFFQIKFHLFCKDYNYYSPFKSWLRKRLLSSSY